MKKIEIEKFGGPETLKIKDIEIPRLVFSPLVGLLLA